MKLAWPALLVLLAACGGANAPVGNDATPARTESQTMVLLAAASMRDALNDAATAFSQKTGYTVTPTYQGTNELAQQILQGSQADLFVSADTDWMKRVEDGGAVDGKSALIATNRLVCITSADAIKPKDAAALKDMRFKVLAIAAETVPAGKYARQAIGKLGLSGDLNPRFVGQKDVRAVLRAVAAGEAEAGFVYRTDAAIEPKVVTAFEFDTKLHSPIVYPAAVLKEGKAKEAARAFLEFLLSKEGSDILARRGFDPAEQ